MVKLGMPLGTSEIMSGVLGRVFAQEAIQAGDYRSAAAHLSNTIRVVQDAAGKAEGIPPSFPRTRTTSSSGPIR